MDCSMYMLQSIDSVLMLSIERDVNTRKLAEWTGLEPATPGVTGRYSNQLNYHSAVVQLFACCSRFRPSATNLATLRGFEPRYSP